MYGVDVLTYWAKLKAFMPFFPFNYQLKPTDSDRAEKQIMADELPSAEAVLSGATTEDNSVKVDESAETTKSPKELIDAGNQALALGKYSEAVEHFSFAVEKLVEQHGELAVETVDALELYGNALLKYAISQSAVLGNEAASNKVPTAEGTPAPAPATVTAPTASSSKPQEKLTTDNIRFHFGGDAEEEEEEEDDDEKEGDEDENAEEEQDDFEDAWNVLDTARSILVKSDGTSDKERKLQLARIHCSIAEVAIETSKFEDGVKEYQTALKIQEEELPAWNRVIAQTHLLLALALETLPNTSLDSKEEEAKTKEECYQKAIEHVERSKDILKNRELYLKGLYVDPKDSRGKGKEGEQPAEGIATKELSEKDDEELKDIQSLNEELDMKIEELQAQIEEARQKPVSLNDQIFTAGPKLPENVSKEVHNLNSLVKKKPKKAEGTSPAPANGSDSSTAVNGKRKAEEDLTSAGTDSTDKRTKVDVE